MLSSVDYLDNRNIEDMDKNMKNLNLKEPIVSMASYHRYFDRYILNLCS